MRRENGGRLRPLQTSQGLITSQFVTAPKLNPFDPITKDTYESFDGKRRVVLNLRYRPANTDGKTAIKAIEDAMRNRGISEVVYIDEYGQVVHIIK